MVDVGNVVQAQFDCAAVIQRIDPIYANLRDFRNDLPPVPQQMAGGKLTARYGPVDGNTSGRICSRRFHDNNVQNATGTVNLRVTINNARTLRPASS